MNHCLGVHFILFCLVAPKFLVNSCEKIEMIARFMKIIKNTRRQ